MPPKLTERYIYMDEWSFFLPECSFGYVFKGINKYIHSSLPQQDRIDQLERNAYTDICTGTKSDHSLLIFLVPVTPN